MVLLVIVQFLYVCIYFFICLFIFLFIGYFSNKIQGVSFLHIKIRI